MKTPEIMAEIERLKNEFPGADDNKLQAMEALIEQAAFERVYLQKLNDQAMETGLVSIHPENAKLQRVLPISSAIAKHSATLTNIMDKLMKHLSVEMDDEDDGLDDYE